MKITILTPVYNDWKSASKLIEEINIVVKDLDAEFSLVIVNDASTDEKSINSSNTENLSNIEILNIKDNQGHGRCIATGLKYVFQNKDFDYVIPMDSDGEDRPEEIKSFFEYINYDKGKPIVGERVKRSENLIFKFCYHLHKLITYAFTGQSIKFGNYTCLPRSTVKKLINDKSAWCSFSGALAKLEKNRSSSPSVRGSRYFGPSKMSFKNLIKHSLSIISVFKIAVVLRSIFFFLVYFFLIYKKITLVMLFPVLFVIIFNILIFLISRRENLEELNNSLINIDNIEKIK
tara:strand:+ start:153 stop:1022 length:870 start_codon:yes stop_codon:yes gene_type:complete